MTGRFKLGLNFTRWKKIVAIGLTAIITFSAPGTSFAADISSSVSFKLTNGLKEDYLKRICKNNLLTGLFVDSYFNWLTSSYSGYSDQYWNQFSLDAQNLIRQSQAQSKWMKKNQSKFPSSARKAVATYISSNDAQTSNIQAMLNSRSNGDLVSFEYNNWSRGQSFTANASGKIRKALRLPPRGSSDGCP